MPINKTQGIVLSRRDFRETSLIANFYTRDFGKISGILKGLRQDPAKFASTLEPFSLNEVIFYEKRNSSLHLISACDLQNNFGKIRQNIQRIAAASVMTELLDVIMPAEDKNEGIFDLALAAIQELESSGNPDKIATIFKIKILSLSGFKPHFDSCVSCRERILGQSKFSLESGGLLCERCFNKDMKARSIFRGTVASVLHIEKNDFKSSLNLGMNPQIKKELEYILNAFLNFHIGKELKSQRVANSLTYPEKEVMPVT